MGPQHIEVLAIYRDLIHIWRPTAHAGRLKFKRTASPPYTAPHCSLHTFRLHVCVSWACRHGLVTMATWAGGSWAQSSWPQQAQGTLAMRWCMPAKAAARHVAPSQSTCTAPTPPARASQPSGRSAHSAHSAHTPGSDHGQFRHLELRGEPTPVHATGRAAPLPWRQAMGGQRAGALIGAHAKAAECSEHTQGPWSMLVAILHARSSINPGQCQASWPQMWSRGRRGPRPWNWPCPCSPHLSFTSSRPAHIGISCVLGSTRQLHGAHAITVPGFEGRPCLDA